MTKNNSKISLIVLISENRVMARDHKVPWKLEADVQRYLTKTNGRVCIAGRKSFDSRISYKKFFVVTRDSEYKNDRLNVEIVHSLDEALQKAREIEQEEIMIIGGGEVFKQTIDIADKLYLTVVHETITGDVYFPDYSDFTKVTFKEDHEENGVKFTFLDLERMNFTSP